MPCTNCGKSAQAAPSTGHDVARPDPPPTPDRHRFGRCSRCFVTSIIALLVAMLPAVAVIILRPPTALRWIAIVPLLVASVWLTLHVIGYLRHR